MRETIRAFFQVQRLLLAFYLLLITLVGYVAEINISTIVRGIVILEVIAFNSIMYKKCRQVENTCIVVVRR